MKTYPVNNHPIASPFNLDIRKGLKHVSFNLWYVILFFVKFSYP